MKTHFDNYWYNQLDEVTSIVGPVSICSISFILFVFLCFAGKNIHKQQRVKDIVIGVLIAIVDCGITGVLFLQGLSSVTDAVTIHRFSSALVEMQESNICPKGCLCHINGITTVQMNEIYNSFILIACLFVWNIVVFILITLSMQLSETKTKYDDWKIIGIMKATPRFLIGKGVLLVAALFAKWYIYALTLPVAIAVTIFSQVKIYNITLLISWFSLYYYVLISALSPQCMVVSLWRIIEYRGKNKNSKISVSGMLSAPISALILTVFHVIRVSIGLPDKWIGIDWARRKPTMRNATFQTAEFVSSYAASFIMTIPFVGPYIHLLSLIYSKSSFWLHADWLYEEEDEQGSNGDMSESTETQHLVTNSTSTQKPKQRRMKWQVGRIDPDSKLPYRKKVTKMCQLLFIPIVSLLAIALPHGVNFKGMIQCDLLGIC